VGFLAAAFGFAAFFSTFSALSELTLRYFLVCISSDSSPLSWSLSSSTSSFLLFLPTYGAFLVVFTSGTCVESICISVSSFLAAPFDLERVFFKDAGGCTIVSEFFCTWRLNYD
jgi:hypothetical protein